MPKEGSRRPRRTTQTFRMTGLMAHHQRKPITLVSGGQSGADLAALRFAVRHGLPHGGWCPRGRKQEYGIIPARFDLRETPSAGYAQRTLWNVRDSDGTVVLSLGRTVRGGTRQTIRFARQLRKPYLHLCALDGRKEPAAVLGDFIRRHRIRRLNVAGPRQSQEPGIGRFVGAILKAALGGGLLASA